MAHPLVPNDSANSTFRHLDNAVPKLFLDTPHKTSVHTASHVGVADAVEIESEIIDVPAQVVAYLVTAPIHPARAPEDVVEQRAVVDAGRRIVTLAVGGVPQYALFGISSVPVARSAYREKEVLARYLVIDET